MVKVTRVACKPTPTDLVHVVEVWLAGRRTKKNRLFLVFPDLPSAWKTFLAYGVTGKYYVVNSACAPDNFLNKYF